MTADDRSDDRAGRSRLQRSAKAPASEPIIEQLVGRRIPPLRLESTDGDVDIAVLASTLLVLFIYPHATGLPDEPVPGWARIPGAAGCTAEACGFRDLRTEFARTGASVAGLSVQTAADQAQFASRLTIPFRLVSDPDMRLGRSLGLPTFEAGGKTFYRRLTIVARREFVAKVFYPIDDPQNHARDAVRWLKTYGS
jgi:peroxiredoxin